MFGNEGEGGRQKERRERIIIIITRKKNNKTIQSLDNNIFFLTGG
jgi:hypothetical protein